MPEKLFIGLEESNIEKFLSPCCEAALSIEPLCVLTCGICGKRVKSEACIPVTKKRKYRVYSTEEKVYIESSEGCLARFCNLSAEFSQTTTWIEKCTFKQFQEEALKRGFVVKDKYCPEWAK
jgi:hypothetical protein